MPDPFDELASRLDESRTVEAGEGPSEEDIETLRAQWKEMFSVLGRQAHELVARLKEREDVAGDVRPTDYGFRLKLAADVGNTRRECSVGFPHELRTADVVVDEDGVWGPEGGLVARLRLPLSSRTVAFNGSGQLAWMDEQGVTRTAQVGTEDTVKRFISDLVAQDLIV